jgi:hypothetical protein
MIGPNSGRGGFGRGRSVFAQLQLIGRGGGEASVSGDGGGWFLDDNAA